MVPAYHPVQTPAEYYASYSSSPYRRSIPGAIKNRIACITRVLISRARRNVTAVTPEGQGVIAVTAATENRALPGHRMMGRAGAFLRCVFGVWLFVFDELPDFTGGAR